MQNKISAIKLDGFVPEIKYRNTLGDQTVKNGKRCHQDMKTAMQQLDVHFAILSGQTPEPMNEQSIDSYCTAHAEELQQIEADSFTVKGNAISITGTRVLPNAKIIKLGSPEQSFEMDSYDYPYIDALSELVEQLRHEGECYIEGKEYVENQLDLFDEEHNEEVKVAATTVKKSAKKIKDLMTGHGAEVEIIEHTDVSQEF